MTPFEMAKLHLLSGSLTRPWSESEYKILLSTDTIRFFYVENGFLVGRLIGPDAEILNVIVHPKYRRLGKARYLIDKFEKEVNQIEFEITCCYDRTWRFKWRQSNSVRNR